VHLLTWNINGIRSLPRPFAEVLPSLGADIVCLQETKVTRDQLDSSLVHVDGFNAFFAFCRVRGGYSGVAVYCSDRLRPLRAGDSLLGAGGPDDSVGSWPDGPGLSAAVGCDDDPAARVALDSEGRCLLIEFPTSDGRGLVLITVYCPNADPSNEARMQFKMRYHRLLRLRADCLLRSGKHVIIAGDLNVSHRLIDHCETAEALPISGGDGEPAGRGSYSDALHQSFLAKPVRHWLDRLLVARQRDPALAAHRGELSSESDSNSDSNSDSGSADDADQRRFIDAFRQRHPDRRDAYTCWCSRTGARQTNYGNRIDYVLVSHSLADQLLDCDIQPEVSGSDHCPVLAVLSDGYPLSAPPDQPLPSLAAARLPEFAARQRRISDFLAPWRGAQQAPMPPAKQEPPPASLKKRKQPQQQPQPAAKRRQASLSSFFAKPTPTPEVAAPAADSSVEKAAAESDSNGSVSASSASSTAASSSQQWRQLLTGPEKPPLCRGHGEACLLRTVKKDGPNRGRRFWVCRGPRARPRMPRLAVTPSCGLPSAD
ncbi:hypothetical protein BOX15_Mlig026136g3, partial [Macrostomum lignano]